MKNVTASVVGSGAATRKIAGMMHLLRFVFLPALLVFLAGCASGPTDAERRAAAAEQAKRVAENIAAMKERSAKAAAERAAPMSEERRRELADADRAKRLAGQDEIRQRLLLAIRDSKFPEHDKARLHQLEEKWAVDNRISDTAEAERRKTPEERAAETAALRKKNEEREARRLDEYMAHMRKVLEDRPTYIEHPARTICKKVGETQECVHYPAYSSAMPAKKKGSNSATAP